MASEEKITIVIDNALSPTSYNLIPLLADGGIFGQNQAVKIVLQDDSTKKDLLQSLAMETVDCCFPLLAGIRVTDHWGAQLWDSDLVVLPLPLFSPSSDSICKITSYIKPIASALDHRFLKTKVLIVGKDAELAAYTLNLLASALPASSIIGIKTSPHQGMLSAHIIGKTLASWWSGSKQDDIFPLIVYSDGSSEVPASLYYSQYITVPSPCHHVIVKHTSNGQNLWEVNVHHLQYVIKQCNSILSLLTISSSQDTLFVNARL